MFTKDTSIVDVALPAMSVKLRAGPAVPLWGAGKLENIWGWSHAAQ